MTDSENDRLAGLERMMRDFARFVPHNLELGMRMIEVGEGRATTELPYQDKLVGNPETGVLHGGAITTLLDACAGAAVFMALREPTNIATLDLRIDYLKPATPQESVFADAHCYKVTRSVAFVRALAHHGDRDDPIASAAGTFILSAVKSTEGPS